MAARLGRYPLAHVALPDPEDEVPETTTLEKKVMAVIDVIRPAIQADEGDIFFRAVDPATGVVSVELTGACVTCPVSTATLKDGIERILTSRVDGVTSVEHVGAALADPDENGTSVVIGGSTVGTTKKVSPVAL